jgi:hypothetical protein
VRNELTGSRLLVGSGFDADATVAYLVENGGACDCGVLLNVDAGVRVDLELARGCRRGALTRKESGTVAFELCRSALDLDVAAF